MSEVSQFSVQRPTGPNAGTQRWKSLLFCHWQVSVETVSHLIPESLEVDTFDGTAWLGLVPFKMREIRPSWLPRALALNFLETNVRTYVTHKGRPGVYFFSLDANSRAAVLAARIGWSLPYFYADMSASVESDRYSYRSHRPGNKTHLQVGFRIDKDIGRSTPGTLEYFLLERYYLFAQRRGSIAVGQVFHEPYHAYTATIDEFDQSLASAAGFPLLDRTPELAHYSPGVDVEVFAMQRH